MYIHIYYYTDNVDNGNISNDYYELNDGYYSFK